MTFDNGYSPFIFILMKKCMPLIVMLVLYHAGICIITLYIIRNKAEKNSYVSAVAGGQKKSHPGGRDCFFFGKSPHR